MSCPAWSLPSRLRGAEPTGDDVRISRATSRQTGSLDHGCRADPRSASCRPEKAGGQSQAEPRVWEPEDQEHVSKGGSSRSRGSVRFLCLPFSSIQTLGRQDGTRPGPTSSVRTVFLLSLPSETLNSSGINHHNSRKQAKPGRNPDVWFAAEAFAVTTHPCFPKEDSGDLGRSLPRGPQDVAGSQLTVYTLHEMASCHGPSSVLCIARRATAPPAPTR